ncbi:MAG: hypothetical protein HYX89_07425, partial [Chloroflexi bacterium]|nr:hypothetical protein [Chloroflexota bacterium]
MGLGPIEIVWLAGWGLYMFGIYAPYTRRFRRQQIAQERTRPLDIVLDMTTFIAWQVLPVIWIFTGWLELADYRIPMPFRWLGSVGFASALVLLRTAYRELGQNWSPKIDIRQGQNLVTTGIFKHVRHPIYAGIWL